MKVHLKILPFLLTMGFSMLTACKKGDLRIENISEGIPPVIILPEKKLIPQHVGAGRTKMTFSYTANQSLSKIDYGDGTSTVLEFTPEGKPSQLIHYDGEELLSYTQYILDNSGRVHRAQTYSIVGNKYMQVGAYTLSYNTDSQIDSISFYNGKEILTGTAERLYTANGNLIREQNSNTLMTADYTYDHKNGLFKNVSYAWLFAVGGQNKLFLSAFNNISTCSYPAGPASNQVFTYTYNEDNYPETLRSVISGIQLSYNVTYRAIQ